MSFSRFCDYTLIGETLWNSLLLWLGYWLEHRWAIILKYRGPIDIAVVAGLVLAVGVWVYLQLRRKTPAPAADHSGGIQR